MGFLLNSLSHIWAQAIHGRVRALCLFCMCMWVREFTVSHEPMCFFFFLLPPNKATYLQDFVVDALEKFVEVASTPIVTLFNNDPSNHPFVVKFFDSPDTKVWNVDL